MNENNLLKIALIVSILGLVLLFIISINIDVEEKTIEKITLGDMDKYVKVKGTVSKIIDTDKAVIMDISQQNEITVVLFKENNASLNKGDTLEVIGKVQEYNGKLEIIGQRVRIVD